MNYNKIYTIITRRAMSRTKSIGLEKHHILPQSCGGSNVDANCVYLTTREHFICHRLLIKIFNDNVDYKKKMIYALWWMSKTRNGLNNHKVTSHTYAAARKLFIENHPNKDPENRRIRSEKQKAGLYNYDYNKVSKTLKASLSSLTTEEHTRRSKNSWGQCDQQARALAIKKGKGSQVRISSAEKDVIFWSYDDVKTITGMSWSQIRYRIKFKNGILPNGNYAEYINRYTGNDPK